MFYAVLMIIMVNELILVALEVVPRGLSGILDPTFRNESFIFGPNQDITIVLDFILFFVPDVFTKIPIGPNAGKELYWPLIWMLVPAYIYVVLFGLMNYILVKFLIS